MPSPLVNLVTWNRADRAAWQLALRSVGAEVQLWTLDQPFPVPPATLWVVVLDGRVTLAQCSSLVQQISGRTLLVSDGSRLVWQLSTCLEHPVLLSDMPTALQCLPLLLQLLEDMTAGCVRYQSSEGVSGPSAWLAPPSV